MARNTRKKVDAYKHPSSRRTKIPTDQSEVYMPDEAKESVNYKQTVHETVSGPMLSWDRGVDPNDLEIQAHPLYIHEKVRPASFIESLLVERGGKHDFLWDDFNGFPEGSTYEWYKHSGNWQNRIIRGDSSRIMASLIAKEGMAGKVQMVYFDPPYGISFKSNFQTSTRSRQVGTSVTDIPNDPPVVSCFRDTYQNGIHSYLDNIYKNGMLARELLSDSGSIFVQIGPDNVHRLAIVLDEVFGAENRVATIPFAKSGGTATKHLPLSTDFILWYAKDKENLKYRQLYEILSRPEKLEHMSWAAAVELADGTSRPISKEEKADLSLLPDGARLYKRMSLTSMHESSTGRSDDYVLNGKEWKCPPNSHWRVSKEGMDRLAEIGRLHAGEHDRWIHWKRYEDEVPGRRISNLWSRQMSADELHYVVETAESVIERCLLMSTDPGDLVLDITCGSGTSAYVSEKWGRRWITTDTNGVAVSLARQRISTGVFDYHILRDSPEGEKLEADLSGKRPRTGTFRLDISMGFVYKRVPTVSAAILAYDLEVEPTYLVNDPYPSENIIRVASPFTVESESPYRFIPPSAERTEKEDLLSVDQLATIKSALEKSGISGRSLTEDQRLRFTEIVDWVPPTEDGWTVGSVAVSPITHTAWAHIPGKGEPETQAAIAIAPDDMTVSNSFVDRAAESAGRIGGVSLLVVIAFAFEAGVRATDVEQRGKLKILKAQANRDLQIGNLRDSHSDHAFVMIGEPEVKVEDAGKGLVTVEVLGYDTYNPASGNVEPGGARDIACWMVDTNYDGKSFYARDIHFPSPGDRQIDHLKKRLGRNLDREAWTAMLSHKSMPFKRPKTGRIAVRIVTTTHTEMTTVIDCESELGKGGT